MAAKSNTEATQIDKSSFFWVGACGICHPGGGAGEYDRYGKKYFDPRSDQFGFEAIGLAATQVGLDGDYAFVPGSGVPRPAGHPTPPAEWNKTWTSEPDCMLCHADQRVLNGEMNLNWVWRTAAMRGMANLKDSAGNTVHSYMAASTAGQGWFDTLEMAPSQPGVPPTATKLDISYRKGIANGQLALGVAGEVMLLGTAVVDRPRDAACWGCHATPDLKKRARTWFDPDRDVHYRRFTLRHDADPSNDIAPERSQACTVCHPAGYDHHIAKGDPFEDTVASDRNYEDFVTCRDCHAPGNAYGAPVPTDQEFHRPGHLERISCQVCHIPSKDKAAQLVVDNAVSGVSTEYDTAAFLSADPLDPAAADKSRWYPSYHVKQDADGHERIFPAKLLNVVWWGAWYHGDDGLPNTADDFVRPIALWRIRAMTGGAPLSGATDDNGDGRVEINRPDEIRLYIARLRGDLGTRRVHPGDPHDYVLVKGGKVWWLDGDGQTGTVNEFELHADASAGVRWQGAKLESAVPFSIDHNVLAKSTAFADCAGCHVSPSPNLLDRKVLLDPFGPDDQAQPRYETTREVMAREGFRFLGQ
ncbi:MAG: hypothetical protein R3F56_12160 [Planctomycetota bacterium]